MTLVWSSRMIGESSRFRGGSRRESDLSEGFPLAENSRPYIDLLLPRDYTQCVSFIGHAPHPRNAYLHWSRLKSMQCLFPELFC